MLTLHLLASVCTRMVMECARHRNQAPAVTYLHGVHGDVDAAVQQRLVDLLREQALAANVRQRLPEHLRGRRSSAEAPGPSQTPLRKCMVAGDACEPII